MDTQDQQTLQKVQECVKLIDKSLLVPYEQLQSITSYPETLEVMQSRQFCKRGLVHISDACFLVFVHKEQLRVDLNSTNFNSTRQIL